MIGPKFHIKKNDLVMVIAGKEKGKSGRVLRILPEKERVIVEKINFVKRHTVLMVDRGKEGFLRKKRLFISLT